MKVATDQQAVVGLRVREKEPDWCGDQNPIILLYSRPRSQGWKKEEGRGKGRDIAAVGGPWWVRNKVRGTLALPLLPPN